jgi:hypothetical protein
VFNESPIVGRPAGLELSGPVLWVRDAAGDPYLHALDASTGEVLQSVGRKGSGPGEFESVFQLSAPSSQPGSVWAFDLQQQRLTFVTPDEPPSRSSPVIPLQGSPRVVKAVWVAPGEFVGVNEFPRERFVRFDSLGHRVATAPGELLGDSTVPEAARSKATITAFTICPDTNGGFALAYNAAGRVELYSPSAHLRDTVSVPYPSHANFVLDEKTNALKWSYDRVWYLGCDAGARNLYAVFGGRKRDAFPPEQWSVGRFLHVFSLEDGSLSAVYRLDPPVSDIQVGPDEITIYASSPLTAKVYKFTLPPKTAREHVTGS